MRKIVSVCFLLLSMIVSAQDKVCTINGRIDEARYNGQYIYLQKMSDDRKGLMRIDSALVQDNKFVIKYTSKINEPELGFVSSSESEDMLQALVVLESGVVDLVMGKPSLVSGTAGNEACYHFVHEQEQLKMKLQSIMEKIAANELEEESGAEEYDAIIDTIKEKGLEYTKSNIGNEVGEFFLFSFMQLFEPADVLALLSETRPKLRNSQTGTEMKAYFEKKAKTGKGHMFMDFKLLTPDGQPMALSDYAGKGKVVLVDFWASWCGPCIKEMPNVIKAYNEYKDKGFEIVGVSFDTNADAWKGALSRLNMTWPQMSDLKGWESQAGQLYGITSIPFTMLLDKDGKIIATNLRGVQLHNKLKELLD